MAIKKTQLYSHLWKAADELRGGMDASQYKDYVLVILFVKYISDKYAKDPYASFVIPEGSGFQDMVKAKGKTYIGEEINKIIAKIAEENALKGIIDQTDFDDDAKLGHGKEKVDRLSNLIAIFENEVLDFSKNKADGDDILGDVYEYFMKNFATEAGKSKGQFYTPAEVSRIMAKIIEAKNITSSDMTIYDPTCGSGSLLLKVANEAKDNNGVEATIYGQEKDNATRALSKMNMILHGFPSANIMQGNTLSAPEFKNLDGGLKRFDFCVANPPFSDKQWRNGVNAQDDPYHRFDDGIPPAKNGDYAYLLHFIKSLKNAGKGAIILPHGVLFRGNAEGSIRRNIVSKGYIKGIIGLPPNLFYGTGIPAIILMIDKENAQNRKNIFMIDAGKGYMKDGPKNRLRELDIHKIVDTFLNFKEIPEYSRIVPLSEIEANDYNLNIPRYIDNSEEEDLQDINAHLFGGIPDSDIDKLKNFWDIFPNLKDELFEKYRLNYSKLKVQAESIGDTIFEHYEFSQYLRKINEVFKNWEEKNIKNLKEINQNSKAGEIIEKISEDLLNHFENVKLIDKYDVYQQLMDYWHETMRDDVYIIIENGWKADVNFILDSKGRPKKDEWSSELLPKEIVINKYFPEDKQKIEELENQREEIISQKEELEEENSAEEGLLEEVKSENGKISKIKITQRIKDIKNEPDFADELEILQKYLKLLGKETGLNGQIKEMKQELDKKLLEKYHEFSEEEVKALIVEDKWLNAIVGKIREEQEKVSKRLTQRIKQLAQRYEIILKESEDKTDEFERKVKTHLENIGFEI
ncbi:MAG: type I restriction-modification system subunit M [bacterium]